MATALNPEQVLGMLLHDCKEGDARLLHHSIAMGFPICLLLISGSSLNLTRQEQIGYPEGKVWIQHNCWIRACFPLPVLLSPDPLSAHPSTLEHPLLHPPHPPPALSKLTLNLIL